jgi:hypothetical protein
VIRNLIFALAFVTSFNVLVMADESSTRKDFQEFGELCVGRWAGEITLIADWPGEKNKKGSKVTAYREYTWAADKNAIQVSHNGGTSAATEIIAFDPISKKIKWVSVNTGGAFAVIEIWKKSDDVFGWRLSGGGTPDGQAYGGEGEWRFSKDRKTITGSVTLGGKSADPLNDVYVRLSP